MKRLSKLVLSAILACSLFGCGQQSASGVKDGEFSAVEQGFGGEVKVTLKVSGGKVEDVQIDASKETPDRGGVAAETLAQEIKDRQSPNVDAISGSTITSDAIIKAAKSAFEQAGFKSEAAVEQKGEDETVDTDVLVIGMGASGTMAALAASESGAKVIGVEATDVLGGFGNAAQGMFAIGSKLQEERYGDNMQTDEKYWYEYMQDHNSQLGNGKLIRTFVAEAKNTVAYCLDNGVQFYLSEMPQQIAHFDTDVVYHRWNGAEPFKHFAEKLEEDGVEVLYNTTAQELIADADGNVVGAICEKKDGGKLTVNAKSVVVSTGSFAANQELMKEALGETVYNNAMVIKGNPLPGIEMMWDKGAAKGELLTMNHGVVTMGAGEETVSQLTLNSPILWVNSEGKRFMNEDLLKDTVEFSSAVVAQGGLAYTIIDQTTADRWTDTTQPNTGSWVHYWDRFGIKDENGKPTIYHAPIAKETWDADWQAMEEAGAGKICQTLDEAAEFIGCDKETLKETVANYNAFVAAGKDTEFFKDPADLTDTVETGPFYVTCGHSGVLGALGGVNTTEKLEVLTDDYKVIKGLYATGNNVSGVSVAAYQNVEGVGLGFSLTSGRLAGKAAAEFAGEQ